MFTSSTINAARHAACAAAAGMTAVITPAVAQPKLDQEAPTMAAPVATLRAGIRQFRPGALEAGEKLSSAKTARNLALPGTIQNSTCLQKTFPVTVAGSGGVAWYVCVTDMGRKGLWVGPAYVKRSAATPWLQVLHQAGLADIFVPYHDLDDFRPYDLLFTQGLSVVTQADAGENGSPVSLVPGRPPTVVAEVRERGIAWLCKNQPLNLARRGEEFVLWGVIDGGNYDNLMHYSFRDDGTIEFRAGHTGYISSARPTATHIHTSLWRVDIDLNGSFGDSAYLVSHREPLPTNPLQAVDVEVPFNGGREGGARWAAEERTALLVQDSATNPAGVNRIGYEFVHLRNGTSRHFGPGEEWTRSDFFVAQYRFNELAWINSTLLPANYLPAQVADGQSVMNQDLVVWMLSSTHHEPHDEDLSNTGDRGITLVHWSGFNMEPHNLFAANPLGGQEACGP